MTSIQLWLNYSKKTSHPLDKNLGHQHRVKEITLAFYITAGIYKTLSGV